ncbi:MAG: Lrp/AsnC family transcriptional regulator [Betaproteobacteria bacterium]
METPLDVRLLNDFRQNFPLCPAPFAELAARLDIAESAVLRLLEKLRREGKIARVGAVFAPKRIGASTLVAMTVAAGEMQAVSEAINRFPEVNHCCEREHYYNLWFVVTAGSEARLQAALEAIEEAAGKPIVRLPLEREYPLVEVAQFTALDEIGRRLVMALQEGLPLFFRPFSVLATRVGCDENEVLERIRLWCEEGVIKRFGVVARYPQPLAYSSALLVHDIPDDKVAQLGDVLAREPDVTLCYQRSRRLPEWPYNLFCMVSGPARNEVQARITQLRRSLDLTPYMHDILFTLPRLGEQH